MKIYATKVEFDADSKQFSILFPPQLDFIQALRLNDGEVLIWEVEDDKITIKKKVN